MTRERRPTPSFCVVAALTLPLGVLGQEIRLGNEFQVNTYTPNNQLFPAVAADSDGNFVVAWQSEGQDGSSNGVFAQRFAAPITLDIDGNGSTQPLTDGLLVLRFFFGFTGATLTTGAVDLGGCERCDSTTIEPYLAGLSG